MARSLWLVARGSGKKPLTAEIAENAEVGELGFLKRLESLEPPSCVLVASEGFLREPSCPLW
jgi:hypothetical protein